jgi:tetrapyrrole methylase family protein/MazG family protein
MTVRRPTFEDLVATMARLRGPGGCPWDHEQSHQSLRPYILEEAYETLEAIDSGSPDQLRQELGDLLLQVVFHAQMAAEAGTFTVDDVVAGLVDKLIRRHPHVFGDVRVAGSHDVLAHWEAIKARERTEGLQARGSGEGPPPGASALDGLPRTLPALMLAQRMQEQAARTGVTWPDLGAAAGLIREALGELQAAAAGGDRARAAETMGELLFTVTMLPRYLELDAEQTLREACAEFRDRFTRLEEDARVRGRPLREYTASELLALWRAAR